MNMNVNRLTAGERRDLGDRLRLARERKGLYHREVAEALGVSRYAVGKWERAAALPQRESQAKLADLYGMPVEGLFAEAFAALARPVRRRRKPARVAA